MKKISALISGILACIMILTACDAKTTDGTSGEEGTGSGDFPILGMQGVDAADMFTERDLDTGYEDAGRLYRWFETVTDFNEIDDGETHILLCHYPMLYHKQGYMIHGHLHHGRGRDYELLRQLPRVLNAGVDVNRYRPVTLAELVENNRAFYAGERDDEVPPPPPMERGLPGSLPGKPDFRHIPLRKEDV